MSGQHGCHCNDHSRHGGHYRLPAFVADLRQQGFWLLVFQASSISETMAAPLISASAVPAVLDPASSLRVASYPPQNPDQA